MALDTVAGAAGATLLGAVASSPSAADIYRNDYAYRHQDMSFPGHNPDGSVPLVRWVGVAAGAGYAAAAVGDLWRASSAPDRTDAARLAVKAAGNGLISTGTFMGLAYGHLAMPVYLAGVGAKVLADVALAGRS